MNEPSRRLYPRGSHHGFDPYLANIIERIIMPTDARFAFLITWTTYGTWLPGDERGHVSPVLQSDHRYAKRANRPGTECAAGDTRTRNQARRLQRFDTVWLNSIQARNAAEGLAKAALSRAWRMHRAAVMANHVHVVIEGCPRNGPSVRRILKGISQAVLSSKRRWWTRGGSDRLLRGERAIEAAIRYVANQHGKLAEIIDGQLV